MHRLLASISLTFSSLALAQEPPAAPATPPTRVVLKALPLGGEEDIASRPLPEHLPAVSVVPEEKAIPLETTSAPTPLDLQPSGDDAIRLQIFLDESMFGPGVIDGRPGLFTQLAVKSWNEVNGHILTDWTQVNTAARMAVKHPYATSLVPELAKEWINPNLPSKKPLMAKMKRMSYRSYAEFMSERYHTDVPYLVVLNGKSKVYNLKPRDSLIVPNVKPFYIEKVTGEMYKAEESMSQRHVVVDTKMNQARIFEAAPMALAIEEDAVAGAPVTIRPNRGLIASFPITPGKPQFIRYGNWKLNNMIELPSWRYDKQLLETGKRGTDSLEIPPGPNSPVGIIWNGTSRSGIGLHGTPDPETIGRARSAGCVRLANWDAIRLPTLIRPGASVEIR